MKRQQIAAGNWKMNKTYSEGISLAKAITKKSKRKDVVVILGTPFIHLKAAAEIAKANKQVHIAAQNCHHLEGGAYTGESSVSMIKSTGAKYVIIGHSERREYFEESDKLLAQKTKLALDKGLKVIFCCGEPLKVRKAKKHVSHVARQLRAGLFGLTEKEFSKIVIAYEPIWAIGTGVTASPAEAQDMHAKIRKTIAKKFGDKIAGKTAILYGGSVKPGNAKEIFGQPDVDGGLVGGASLKAPDFVEIINAFA